jgi:hypothetical protein
METNVVPVPELRDGLLHHSQNTFMDYNVNATDDLNIFKRHLSLLVH